MSYRKPAVSPHHNSFIRNVCQSVGINVVKVRTPAVRGRYGWVRVIVDDFGDNALLRSTVTYATEDMAFAAAHAHFKLRMA